MLKFAMILKPYFGEVAEWSIALDLKSSVRKYRGFESHPLRLTFGYQIDDKLYLPGAIQFLPD